MKTVAAKGKTNRTRQPKNKREKSVVAPLRPAWVEIDLAAIESNARRLKEIIGAQTELMAMVKANGYGHGAVESARAALRGGATWLGVYAVGEGVELRLAGLDAPIIVLGHTFPEWAEAAVKHDLRLTVFSRDTVEAIQQAAHAQRKRAQVHVKIDTGMTRLGVNPDETVNFVRSLAEFPNVQAEGLCTHFAVADTPDARGIKDWGNQYTEAQLDKFLAVARAVKKAGLSIRYQHTANSPASVHFPRARLNLARSGILIYGLEPSPESPRPDGFRPALAFKTQLALVREVKKGTFVSYGCTFETTRDSRIGVMMVGYADGFRRGPRRWNEVLVRGQRAPVVGRVCMDQTMIDVTDIPEARAGDEVVLIGRQGEAELSAEQVAENLGTNNYEVVTAISARVPRRYKNAG